MSRKQRILLVDDDAQIRRVLRSALESREFEVRTAQSAAEAFDTFQACQPELIVTDLAMPNGDGISLCRHVRTRAATPIVVLSVKGEEKTKVAALDAGADDYVTKPFGIEELLARIRALLRRADMPPLPASVLRHGDFEVDHARRHVKVRGVTIRLTPREYDMLLYLLAHSDRVLTHRAMLTALWGPHSGNQTEYLRVFVGQLRKKIERTPNSPEYLKTEPWIGYRFQSTP